MRKSLKNLSLTDWIAGIAVIILAMVVGSKIKSIAVFLGFAKPDVEPEVGVKFEGRSWYKIIVDPFAMWWV